ncbi:hypothetical protein Hanom_Chr17g01584841 [Helianthus anomalus]
MALQSPGLTLVRKAQIVVLKLQWKAHIWVLKLQSKAQSGTSWCFVKAQLWVLWILIGPRRRLVLPLKSCNMVYWDATLDLRAEFCSFFWARGLWVFSRPSLGWI